MGKLKDLGALEPDMGSIETKLSDLKKGVKEDIARPFAIKDTFKDMYNKAVRNGPPPKADPRDANIYTAEKGNPPSPDEGPTRGKKKGGKVCGMKKGGKVRGCGCAQRGLTKGRMV